MNTKRIWLRLIQAYGSRVADSYGENMPASWADAVEDFTDQEIDYGIRKCVRDTPIHPPTLGQFIAACADMPQVHTDQGPTIQAQLCAYAALKLFMRLDPKQIAPPWRYLYREWTDETRPKHMQKCAECVGIQIDNGDDSLVYRVDNMRADKEGHAKAMRSFQPGPRPKRIGDAVAS